MSFEADGLIPRVLNKCSHSQRGGVPEHLFSLTVGLMKVPQLWKTFCIVSLPKDGNPLFPEDYSPVDLTSHIARTSKKLALRQTSWTQDNLLIAVTVLTLNSGGNGHSPLTNLHMLYYTGCSAHCHQTNTKALAQTLESCHAVYCLCERFYTKDRSGTTYIGSNSILQLKSNF